MQSFMKIGPKIINFLQKVRTRSPKNNKAFLGSILSSKVYVFSIFVFKIQ